MNDIIWTDYNISSNINIRIPMCMNVKCISLKQKVAEKIPEPLRLVMSLKVCNQAFHFK